MASPRALSLAVEPAIVVAGLRKSYNGRAVLRDLSFEVPTGQVFALLGPNGAGKTTTIEILEGYRRPDAGLARVLGLDPVRQSDELHRRIGLMLQQGGFYPAITPIEAVRLFASFYAEPADPDGLLRLVGLQDAARRRYRTLSGGQKQRLSLAVALVGQPELVFLDEPTAGMDPQARHATWEIVRGLRDRGVTVVLTTHLIDEAERLADRVAIVDNGQIVAEGTPAELSSGGSGDDVWIALAGTVDPRALAALPSVKGAREVRVGEYLVQTPRVTDLLGDLSAWLDREGVALRSIRVGSGSLEDAFLRLTGREFRE
jgi:ABC-2 type transport system ATP-binding protein